MTGADKRRILAVLMKRMLSTIVLFALLILTVFALTQLDTDNTSALRQEPVANQQRITE
jgi:hypothetical protein